MFNAIIQILIRNMEASGEGGGERRKAGDA